MGLVAVCDALQRSRILSGDPHTPFFLRWNSNKHHFIVGPAWNAQSSTEARMFDNAQDVTFVEEVLSDTAPSMRTGWRNGWHVLFECQHLQVCSHEQFRT